MWLRRTFLLGLIAGVSLGACAPKPAAPDAIYYLVRHAEKTTEKPDPALTEAGQARADALAERLKGVNITAVYSSDYTRTRDTAAPTAQSQNQDIEVQLYNPGALQELSDKLKQETGHILVVGHSNTTGELSEFLGGPKGPPIVEATEYDRLYILERTGETVTGRIERYGDASLMPN